MILPKGNGPIVLLHSSIFLRDCIQFRVMAACNSSIAETAVSVELRQLLEACYCNSYSPISSDQLVELYHRIEEVVVAIYSECM